MKKIIAALMAALMVLAMFGACSNENTEDNVPASDYEKIAFKVGDMEYTLNDYNYTYVSTFSELYNYYGSYFDMTKPLSEQEMSEGTTWHDYICANTDDTLKSLTALYEKAKEEGFELPEESQNYVDTLEDTIKSSAENYGMDVDKFIEAMYGKGMTYDSIAKMVEIGTIANDYASSKLAATEVTSEEIKEYYEANKASYDTVTFRYYPNYYNDGETEYTEEQIAEFKAQAEDIATAKTVEEFNEKVRKYAPEDRQEYYANDAATQMKEATYEVIGIDEINNWLYDDARVPFETFVYEDPDYGFMPIMFESKNTADYDTVNVRHILVKPVAGEDGTVPDSAWKDAEKKAKDIYDEFLAGEKTEDAFGELAKEYSEDPGSASNGGLYTDVFKGQMVQNFNDWCFDETRAIGDTGIVETNYGYHIMYFLGNGISNIERELKSTVVNEKFNEWIGTIVESYTVEDGEVKALADGSVILDIVAAADEYAASLEAEQEETENTEETETEGTETEETEQEVPEEEAKVEFSENNAEEAAE